MRELPFDLRALETVGPVEEVLKCARQEGGTYWLDIDSDCVRKLRPPPPAPPTPPEFPPMVLERQEARQKVCAGCDQRSGEKKIRQTVVTLCAAQQRRCSCPNGEVRLDVGRCPLAKWT